MQIEIVLYSWCFCQQKHLIELIIETFQVGRGTFPFPFFTIYPQHFTPYFDSLELSAHIQFHELFWYSHFCSENNLNSF